MAISRAPLGIGGVGAGQTAEQAPGLIEAEPGEPRLSLDQGDVGLGGGGDAAHGRDAPPLGPGHRPQIRSGTSSGTGRRYRTDRSVVTPGWPAPRRRGREAGRSAWRSRRRGRTWAGPHRHGRACTTPRRRPRRSRPHRRRDRVARPDHRIEHPDPAHQVIHRSRLGNASDALAQGGGHFAQPPRAVAEHVGPASVRVTRSASARSSAPSSATAARRSSIPPSPRRPESRHHRLPAPGRRAPASGQRPLTHRPLTHRPTSHGTRTRTNTNTAVFMIPWGSDGGPPRRRPRPSGRIGSSSRPMVTFSRMAPSRAGKQPLAGRFRVRSRTLEADEDRNSPGRSV